MSFLNFLGAGNFGNDWVVVDSLEHGKSISVEHLFDSGFFADSEFGSLFFHRFLGRFFFFLSNGLTVIVGFREDALQRSNIVVFQL